MQCDRIQDEEFAGQKLEVLYGEADAAVRSRVEAHLKGCVPCREEMASLGRLRKTLKAWTLERREPSEVVPTRRPFPSWLTIAAALLLGVGVGLSLFGYLSLSQKLATQEARRLALKRQYEREITALRAELASRTATTLGSAPLDTQGLFARVDERVEQGVRRSEARQRARVEATFADWSGRIEARRRVDLARVAAGLSYLDGRQGQQLARTNELMGYVLEAAAPQE